MKISICSDVHLEFGPLEIHNVDKADVLILSGDILVAKELCSRDEALKRAQISKSFKAKKIYDFLDQATQEFRDVVYVCGNHEHYNGDIAKTHDILREHLSPHYKNLHILEKQCVEINGITFVGGTLWTDMNGGDPLTMQDIKHMMNDFRIIKNSHNMIKSRTLDYEAMGIKGNSYELPQDDNLWIYKETEFPARFDPIDAAIIHKQTLEFIDQVTKNQFNKTFVVVGHHAPSKQSTHPRYKHEYTANGGYSSDLTEFILDRPQIKLWTHGHTHDPYEYQIGSTRIVCNPRGYIGYEARAEEFRLKTVEV